MSGKRKKSTGPKAGKGGPKPQDRIAACAPIFEMVANGMSLLEAARAHKVPVYQTIMEWLSDSEHATYQRLRDNYAYAREAGETKLESEMLTISDDEREDFKTITTRQGSQLVPDETAISRARLQVDTRKWILARRNPKKFGDKVTNVLEGGDAPIRTENVVDPAKALAEITKVLKGDA